MPHFEAQSDGLKTGVARLMYSAAVQARMLKVSAMKLIAAILISAAALAVAQPTWAFQPVPGGDSLGGGYGGQQDQARQGVKQGRLLPLGQIIREINKRDPGYQLDAGLEQQGGRDVYRVRWASSNGRRKDYIVDATSGAILSAQ
jgi:uncharacterized membrane protein YkoI